MSDKGTSVMVPVSYTHLDVYKRQAPGSNADNSSLASLKLFDIADHFGN